MMRYDEIKTDLLLEAKLSPGDVKEIKLKISEYEKKLEELKRKEITLRNELEYNIDYYPAELHDKIQAYINAYTREIAKLKDQLKIDYPEDSFNNFIAGIKKNCSEIVDFYQKERKFLYAAFKTSPGRTALYGKPPEKMVVPKYYEDRRYLDLADMIENKFGLASFDNCVLTSGDPYDVASGDRIAYIVFPRNGFKYFYLQGLEKFFLSDARIPYLLDKDIMLKAWDYFIGNPEMLEKFKSAGGFAYDWSKEATGTVDGFMGRYQWENNVATITKLAEKGLIGEELGKFAYLHNWMSADSFIAGVRLQTDNLKVAISYGYDVALNTSGVYAVSTSLQQKMYRALGMRD